mmetsp:Transcript_18288/g.59855  ORF Transcript_18288/g.59855 Transcript_18288/m.59855 type:complete len:225 (-) Transcript_18288:579-1253(-)
MALLRSLFQLTLWFSSSAATGWVEGSSLPPLDDFSARLRALVESAPAVPVPDPPGPASHPPEPSPPPPPHPMSSDPSPPPPPTPMASAPPEPAPMPPPPQSTLAASHSPQPHSRKRPGFASETVLAALVQSHRSAESAALPHPDVSEAQRSAPAVGWALLAAAGLALCVVFRPRSVDVWCMRAAHCILSVVRPQAAHGFSSRNLSSFDIAPAHKYGFHKVAVTD